MQREQNVQRAWGWKELGLRDREEVVWLGAEKVKGRVTGQEMGGVGRSPVPQDSVGWVKGFGLYSQIQGSV